MPRAAQDTPPKISHDPRLRLAPNLRQKLPNPVEIAAQNLKTLLALVKEGTGIDFASPFALVESIADALAGITGGVVSQITAALTGKTGGASDLEAWAQSLPAQAERAAHDAIAQVNTVVGEIAHDAETDGQTLADTIGSVIDTLAGTHKQTQDNTAAITALSSIAPTNAVTSLAASTDPNDIPAFDRILMVPIAATATAGDHAHTYSSGGMGTSYTSTAGAHTHAIGTDAWAYTPADQELVLVLIRSDRKQQINAVKLISAVTGWSLGGVDKILVSLHAYSEPDAALKLLAQTGDQKDTITTAAQEYAVPLDKSFDVLPGHVLAIGVWQQISFFGATRKLAGIPQVGVKPRTGAPRKAILGKLPGQSSVPATIKLSDIAWSNNAAVWGALTLA